MGTPLILVTAFLSCLQEDTCNIEIGKLLQTGRELRTHVKIQIDDSDVTAVTLSTVQSTEASAVTFASRILRFQGDLLFQDGKRIVAEYDAASIRVEGDYPEIKALLAQEWTVTQSKLGAAVDDATVAEPLQTLFERVFSFPGTLPMGDRAVRAGDSFEQGGYRWKVIEASSSHAVLAAEAEGERLSVEIRLNDAGTPQWIELTRIIRRSGSEVIFMAAVETANP